MISRLKFLQWATNHETIPFFTSTAQADIIWNCLIADPIGKQEQDDAFSYLDRMIEHGHFTNHFFNVRLPELNVRHLSDEAFKYVKNCLLKVNAKLVGCVRYVTKYFIHFFKITFKFNF